MGQKIHPKGFRLVNTFDHLSKWFNKKVNYFKIIQQDIALRKRLTKEFSSMFVLQNIYIFRLVNYTKILLYVLEPTLEDAYQMFLKYQLLDKKTANISKDINIGEIEDTQFLPSFKDTEFNQYFSDVEEETLKVETNKFNKNSETLVKENISDDYVYEENLSQDDKNQLVDLDEIARRQFLEYGQSFTENLFKNILLKTIALSNTNTSFEIKFLSDEIANAKFIAQMVSQQLENRVSFRRIVLMCTDLYELGVSGGFKLEISGRIGGVELARTEWIRKGAIPLQTLSANIDFAQEELNTVYGTIGIKVWLYSK